MNLNKLTELSNSLYLIAATEFKKNGIPPEVGRLVIESVYRRITDDAMSVVATRNANLEIELANKMSEMQALKESMKGGQMDETV